MVPSSASTVTVTKFSPFLRLVFPAITAVAYMFVATTSTETDVCPGAMLKEAPSVAT